MKSLYSLVLFFGSCKGLDFVGFERDEQAMSRERRAQFGGKKFNKFYNAFKNRGDPYRQGLGELISLKKSLWPN